MLVYVFIRERQHRQTVKALEEATKLRIKRLDVILFRIDVGRKYGQFALSLLPTEKEMIDNAQELTFESYLPSIDDKIFKDGKKSGVINPRNN